MSTGALDVFPSRRFGAVHGRGDLLVRQLLEHTQRDGHGLTAGKSINGRENLRGKFPLGEFLPGQPRTVDNLIGRVVRFDFAPIPTATSCHVTRRINAHSAGSVARGLACRLIRC